MPICAVDGRNGGYRLRRSASLPPVAFTAGEATAVAVALAAEPDLPLGPDGHTALTNILQAMPPEQRGPPASSPGASGCACRPPPAARPTAGRVLDEALRHRVVATIDYQDAPDAATTGRPLEPLAFARTHGHWYLLAWCRQRADGRWFRLDRVQQAHLTCETFPPRDLDAVFGPPPDDAHPVQLPH